jgi:hypothetical protein
MPGTLTSRRPCARKSGGSDPPCGRDPEKVTGDTDDRQKIGLNPYLGRRARYSLHLASFCITFWTRACADSNPSQTSARDSCWCGAARM